MTEGQQVDAQEWSQQTRALLSSMSAASTLTVTEAGKPGITIVRRSEPELEDLEPDGHEFDTEPLLAAHSETDLTDPYSDWLS